MTESPTHSLDRINYLNMGLMLVSAVLAYLLPFELFLAAYALLGPLHYLTEISWLHDRQYFSQGKRDYYLLCGLSLLAVFAARFGLQEWTRQYDPILLAFTSAIPMAFISHKALRLSLILVCFPLAYWASSSTVSALFFGVYLPTLVHVYLFTWIFVLYGSLKSKSLTGYYSLGVMTGLAAILLFLPVGAQSSLTPYVEQNISAFGQLHKELAHLFGWDPLGVRAHSAMRFIAFAYTYHYLNWFSKTKIIQWHQVGRVRLSLIIVLYLGFVGTYIYDYRFGLKTLALLSLGHVLLEFPLNLRSIQSIFQMGFSFSQTQISAERVATTIPIKSSKQITSGKRTRSHSSSKSKT